jgi:hypothetical protein
MSFKLVIQVESESLLEFTLSDEARKHSYHSRAYTKCLLFIYLSSRRIICSLPFAYGIESKSPLMSFLSLTGIDMACDDMREST